MIMLQRTHFGSQMKELKLKWVERYPPSKMTKLGMWVLLASDVLVLQRDMTPKVAPWNQYLFSRHDSRDWGFLGGVMVKNLPANAGNVGLIPGSGRSPGEGNGSTLQCSRLENPMDRRAWQAAVNGPAK